MSDDRTAHRWYRPTHQIAFWKGNLASNSHEADRAVLEITAAGYAYPRWEVAWGPEGSDEIRSLELALSRAYERGRIDAKQEIRSVLGVQDPRR